MALCKTANSLIRPILCALDWLAPWVDLLVRLWVASVFFKSGLLKLDSWWKTLVQFERDFHVPLLPPEVAAYLGTGVELSMPVLLAFGLGARFAAFVLFVFNIVAVISFPEIGGTGLQLHQLWGILLLVILTHGPGRISIDHYIAAHCKR